MPDTLLAAGVVVGFGLPIADIDTASARFLATGTPTMLLLIAWCCVGVRVSLRALTRRP